MTIDFPTVRRNVLAIAIAAILFVPGMAQAQGQAYGRVSGSIEQLYDSNLFAAPENSPFATPQADWITRLGPLFEAGYESQPLNVKLSYGFDAEKYQELVELDDAFARQNAATSLTYRGQTYAAELTGEFVRTQSPTDLNVETLRFVGRSPAQRIASSEAFTLNLSPVTKLTLVHLFNRDSLVGAETSAANEARVGLARQLSGRTTVRGDYKLGYTDFSNGREERFHVGTVGLAHALTSMLDFEVNGGVRSTLGDIDPELSAQMRQRMQHGGVALRYVQTRETTIGGGASLQVRRVSGEVNYTPTRAIAFTVTPARASSGGTLSRDVVYIVDIQTRIRATRRWSILALGRAGQQERRLDRTLPTATNDVINYRIVSLKTVVTLGALEREREDAETETR